MKQVLKICAIISSFITVCLSVLTVFSSIKFEYVGASSCMCLILWSLYNCKWISASSK